MIMFGEHQGKLLLAQYCSPDTVPICESSEHVQVKGGNLSLTLVKVNSSSSGLYTAQVITDNKVFYVNATLVVNQASVSSTAPPHSSSSPKPLRSSELRWIVIVIVISLIIVVSGGVCFWKLRRKSKKKKKKKKLLLSPDPESQQKNNCGGCVAVAMNGCGENAEALVS
ncbi:uncharacterized protein LOC143725558 [Siphateles boraxobius]|uniref:uncharacterized protein LOC143725558 n=1 Tax=Siphateles boraxobius TaxID=180520 RepID=UPI0040649F07